jgi:type IV secretion system protein VirB3
MQEVIFKGATRPAMLLDMPMVPTVCLASGALLGGMWGHYISGSWLWLVAAFIVLVPVMAAMRAITKKDDQRVMQFFRRALLQLRHKNKGLWGCRSYSPFVYRGGKDDWMR